jgi:hypothetical protein
MPIRVLRQCLRFALYLSFISVRMCFQVSCSPLSLQAGKGGLGGSVKVAAYLIVLPVLNRIH